MSQDLLGEAARNWAALGADLPAGCLRLILADVDGVITRGEGQPADIDVLQRLSATNTGARHDPCVPAITLCTGRQAPYVELMAQLVDCFLPCIFEHGAGLFFPMTFRYDFDPRLGTDYSRRLADLRAAIDEPLIRSGRAFVQPGKEASLTLYPLGTTTVDELFELTDAAVHRLAPDFSTAPNVNGVEVRPRGIDKGTAARRVSEMLRIDLQNMAGVGDSDPDLAYLDLIGFSAAPANATPAVRRGVQCVANASFGEGLLQIVTLVEQRNRQQILTRR